MTVNVREDYTDDGGVIGHNDVSLIEVKRRLRVVHGELMLHNGLFTCLRLHNEYS